MVKVVFVTLDGCGDDPSTWPRTPLNEADTPNLDFLASISDTGMIQPAGRGVEAASDTGNLGLFGYDPKTDLPGRGVLEALGAGVPLGPSDVALRIDWGTLDDAGRVCDRRAGREDFGLKELAALVDGLEIEGVRFRVFHTKGHRGVLVLSGGGLSPNVSNSDPKSEGKAPLECVPLDGSEEAGKTARVLNAFLSKVRELFSSHDVNLERENKGLPRANVLLARSPGSLRSLESFAQRYGLKAASVAGAPMYKGLARLLGMDVLDVAGATGTPSTSLVNKAKALEEALETYDFVWTHVKGIDDLGHDRDFEGKKKLIERADSELMKRVRKLVEEGKIDVLVVTGDHSTRVTTGLHGDDHVPIIVWRKGLKGDPIDTFSEKDCMWGRFGVRRGDRLMPGIQEYVTAARRIRSPKPV